MDGFGIPVGEDRSLRMAGVLDGAAVRGGASLIAGIAGADLSYPGVCGQLRPPVLFQDGAESPAFSTKWLMLQSPALIPGGGHCAGTDQHSPRGVFLHNASGFASCSNPVLEPGRPLLEASGKASAFILLRALFHNSGGI